MAEVLFGQSYFLRFDPKLWRTMEPYPPLGTLFAASYVRELGYEVALFDAMLADNEAAWESALEIHRPRYAVLYEDNFNYLSKMCLTRMREAAFTMIAAARQHGATVVVCGSDATDHAEAYLQQGAQAVIHGEGEVTLGALLQRLEGHTAQPVEQIRGLTIGLDLLSTNGPKTAPVRTPTRPVMRDLDTLPPPAWDLIDFDRYRTIWHENHGRFSINMATTRGCPFHCNWCAKPIWGQTYNMRSPEHVADEVALLRTRYQVDHIWFADDIMGLKRGWMASFADAVESRRARTPFKCLSRADLLCREGEVDAFRRAGCEIIWIGAESGSQAILDAMEKGTKIEQIREATERVHRAGMKIAFFLQFGYPGESRADIELTRALVRQCKPDEIGMSVSYPLPGTSFHQRVHAELGEKQNWVDSDDLEMMYRGPFTTGYYRQLVRIISKDFRARRASVELRRVLAHPSELRPKHLRRAAAMGFHRATLPFEHLRLARQAKVAHESIGPLAPHLSHDEAAEPSPQRDCDLGGGS